MSAFPQPYTAYPSPAVVINASPYSPQPMGYYPSAHPMVVPPIIQPPQPFYRRPRSSLSELCLCLMCCGAFTFCCAESCDLCCIDCADCCDCCGPGDCDCCY